MCTCYQRLQVKFTKNQQYHRCCRDFECGRQSWKIEHAGRSATTVTTLEIVKKVHVLVLQDKRVAIKQTVEDTDLSHHEDVAVHTNIFGQRFVLLSLNWLKILHIHQT